MPSASQTSVQSSPNWRSVALSAASVVLGRAMMPVPTRLAAQRWGMTRPAQSLRAASRARFLSVPAPALTRLGPLPDGDQPRRRRPAPAASYDGASATGATAVFALIPASTAAALIDFLRRAIRSHARRDRAGSGAAATELPRRRPARHRIALAAHYAR